MNIYTKEEQEQLRLMQNAEAARERRALRMRDEEGETDEETPLQKWVTPHEVHVREQMMREELQKLAEEERRAMERLERAEMAFQEMPFEDAVEFLELDTQQQTEVIKFVQEGNQGGEGESQ